MSRFVRRGGDARPRTRHCSGAKSPAASSRSSTWTIRPAPRSTRRQPYLWPCRSWPVQQPGDVRPARRQEQPRIDHPRSRRELDVERRRQARSPSSCARACAGTTASRSRPRTSHAPSICCCSGENKLRRNPRASWYGNVEKVTADGDFDATFHLKAPQPSLLALLASGYTPIYPCHVPIADMRRKPIGTGPFKFVEFKMNEGIKLTKNTDYWKNGPALSRRHRIHDHADRSTRMLSFVSGRVRHDLPDRRHGPAAART